MAKQKSLTSRIEEIINELDDTRNLITYLSESSFDMLDESYMGVPCRCLSKLLLQPILKLSEIHQELESKTSD